MTDLEAHVNADGRDKLVKQVREKINELGITYIYYQFISVTGRIVGAGMTGGLTFLLDEQGMVSDRVNKEIVEICLLTTPEQEAILKTLLEAHLAQTGSTKAKEILANWISWKALFKLLVPPSEKVNVGLTLREQVAA